MYASSAAAVVSGLSILSAIGYCELGIIGVGEMLIRAVVSILLMVFFTLLKDGNCTYMADIHFDRADCPYTVAEIYFTDIGKTVFLTKEEAEKALKGGIAK